ncbi:MAG TPA: FtsH protease activity modulator HflK [Bryobacteraceae bacterium]|nr:FtsH protease activity modulator HflK [Bryobacteraceae bacterium]
MHYVPPPAELSDARTDRIRTFAFAGFVGFLLLLNFTGVFRTVFGINTAAILALAAGYRVFYHAISSLLARQISADLAIVIAVIAAMAAGEYLAAAEAMFIMLIGEGLESYAGTRTKAAIQRFIETMPRHARLLRDGIEKEVDVEELRPGDLIAVRAGERIAADGEIAAGQSSIDESTITGEPLPRDKGPGEEVFSGTLNGNGLLTVRVARAGWDTTLARVVRLVEEAKSRRAPVVRTADRYARYFLPAILLAAGVTFYFTRDWLRTVSVLIVACPCALILATPAAMVAAIGGLARRGILVRGGSVIEAAAKVDGIIFDKTGTLTEGRFAIIDIVAEHRSEDELLALAAAAESASDHVLARVIVEEARRRGLPILAGSDARVLPGRGAECVLDGVAVRAGNAAYLAENGIRGIESAVERADSYGATAVLIACGDRLAGAIFLRDRVREGAAQAVRSLEQLNIAPLAMLTGDRRRAAEAIARETGIAHVEAELLPEDKLSRVRAHAQRGRRIAMVGDGINDAPSLSSAGVGIAVSGAADITAEAADVVYLGHSLERLPKLFQVSRQAVTIVWQNIIVFAGAINLFSVGLAYSGAIGPMGAAVTHQAASLLVMLNSLRLLRVERSTPARWHRMLTNARARSVSNELSGWVARIDPKRAFDRLVEQRRRLVRPALYAAAALLILSGFYVVGPQDEAILERLGRRAIPNRGPGLHYKLPWPVDRVRVLPARRVQALEVGFRSANSRKDAEPASYEWNVQHRSGRFQRKPEESLFLTGDQNMVEITATIHFRLSRPEDYLYRHSDPETTLRAAAESVLHQATTGEPIDALLTTGRGRMERAVRGELQRVLDRYRAGVEVLQVRLLDVHPSLEVVSAFRDVAGASEEKSRVINEAESYRNERVALARGNAEALLENAQAHSAGRKNRSQGDASRFLQTELGFRTAAGPNETRLYLETLEQVLPGKRKVIVDSSKGRRHLLLLEDGVMVPPSALVPAQERQ